MFSRTLSPFIWNIFSHTAVNAQTIHVQMCTTVYSQILSHSLQSLVYKNLGATEVIITNTTDNSTGVPFSLASTGSCLIFISEDGAESGVLSVDDAVSVEDWLFSLDGSLTKKSYQFICISKSLSNHDSSSSSSPLQTIHCI